MEMTVSRQELKNSSHSDGMWLLLTFTLPKKRASQRVEVWRLLQRYGAIPLGNSGYLLPNNATTRERFEWLATSIRKYSGDASVVTVQSIDNLSTPQLIAHFTKAREHEYQQLIGQLRKIASVPQHKRALGRLSRLRARFRAIAEIDFFGSPLQKRVQDLLARAEAPTPAEIPLKIDARTYTGRTWVTRPRPGIDRSAAGWLIRRYIDKKARFAFATEENVPLGAVPFDMYHGGFGHRGEDCTFETLEKAFRIRDKKVEVIGQIIHDADLLDSKFGRTEGFGIDAILNGWASEGVTDKELLGRGMELVSALYSSIEGK